MKTLFVYIDETLDHTINVGRTTCAPRPFIVDPGARCGAEARARYRERGGPQRVRVDPVRRASGERPVFCAHRTAGVDVKRRSRRRPWTPQLGGLPFPTERWNDRRRHALVLLPAIGIRWELIRLRIGPSQKVGQCSIRHYRPASVVCRRRILGDIVGRIRIKIRVKSNNGGHRVCYINDSLTRRRSIATAAGCC
jgi:hypothetical protein